MPVSFSVGGTNHNIRGGWQAGGCWRARDAGTIDNLGNHQMTGDKTASNYYNNLGAREASRRVRARAKDALDLHRCRSCGQLSGRANDTFHQQGLD